MKSGVNLSFSNAFNVLINVEQSKGVKGFPNQNPYISLFASAGKQCLICRDHGKGAVQEPCADCSVYKSLSAATETMLLNLFKYFQRKGVYFQYVSQNVFIRRAFEVKI